MRHTMLGALILGFLSLGFMATRTDLGPVASASETAAADSSVPLTSGEYWVAAPGRVEPASQEVRVSAAITGILDEVVVREGDKVHRGDVIARIQSKDYAAALAKAEATLALDQAELERVINGARPAERDAAYAAVGEAEAVVKTAETELDRRLALVSKGVATRQAVEQAQRDYDVAEQHRKAAFARYAMVNDPAREEDVTIAKARVEAAQAAVDQARAELDKAVIRSPIAGTVLRVHRRPGELVSTFFVDQPIVTVGDLSKLFVRAEIDEADVGKVAVGEPAYVTAEAFGAERFSGKVVRVGDMLAPKKVYTGETSEKTDTRVLEVLIELQTNTLPPGLRVNSFIQRPVLSAAPANSG